MPKRLSDYSCTLRYGTYTCTCTSEALLGKLSSLFMMASLRCWKNPTLEPRCISDKAASSWYGAWCSVSNRGMYRSHGWLTPHLNTAPNMSDRCSVNFKAPFWRICCYVTRPINVQRQVNRFPIMWLLSSNEAREMVTCAAYSLANCGQVTCRRPKKSLPTQVLLSRGSILVYWCIFLESWV